MIATEAVLGYFLTPVRTLSFVALAFPFVVAFALSARSLWIRRGSDVPMRQ